MNVRLDAIVSAVAAEGGLDPDRVTQDSILCKRFINDTRRELYNLPIRFSALEFNGEVVGSTIVTAGTISATQNQAEVTGVGTAFTTAMSGRYIALNSQPWQRISFVTDSTHLTLESSWNGSTISAKTYKIWKRDYAMPSKCAKITRFVDLSVPNQEVSYFDPSEFYRKFGWADEVGDVVAFTQFGASELGDSYLGAAVFTAVTATANSPILDFPAGSGLVTAIAVGDQITWGNSTTSTGFFVERVLTDTKLVLRGEVNVAGVLSASAMALNRLLVRFYHATDNNKVYYFEGVKDFADLQNSADLLESGWYNAVKKGAIAKVFGYTNNPREQQKIAEYGQEVNNLIRNQYKALNPAIRLKPLIKRRYGNEPFYISDRDTGGW